MSPKWTWRIRAPVAAILAIAFAAGLAASVRAQEPAKPDIESLRRDTAAIEVSVGESAANDDRLVRLRGEAEGLSRKLIGFGVSFRPELAEISAKLTDLGAAPTEGQPPEAPEIAQQRRELLARKAAINAQLAEAESLSIRVSRGLERIGELRRELFTNTLLRRTESQGAFGPETAEAFDDQIASSWRALRSRILFVKSFRPATLYGAVAAVLLVAAGLFLATRRFTRPAPGGDFVDEKSGYIARLSLAFWSTVMPSLAVAAALAILGGLLAYFSVFVGQSLEIFNALLVSGAALFFIQRLAFAVFSPGHPQRRLLAITDRGAWALVGLTVLMAAIYVVDFFLSRLDDISLAPLSLTVAKALVASLSISLILLLIALVRPFAGRGERPKPWPAAIRLPLILLAGVVIASAMSGYVGLARFLAAQIVVTGAILATMYIGLRFGRALSKEGSFSHTGLGARLRTRFELSDHGADLAGLATSLAIYAIVLLVGLPIIALQWGFKWPDISGLLVRLLTDIRVGSVSISLLAVMFGAVVFVIGFLFTRRFQRWLDTDVMRRGRVEAGVRNSVRTVAGYAGIGAAALIGISVAGFNLSNLALIAGALSLGIGFGLQNIVNNFVSGLILLVERPFKVGDWVEAGNVSGLVRKISVRATEIETFHHQTVILPNSEFINNAVSNWTLRNHLGRVDIPVGVAYGSDPEQVMDLLKKIAAADPAVVERPEPSVLFRSFGEWSLNFELRAHLADIFSSPEAQNRIRSEILRVFGEAGIEIPFRDLNPVATPPAAVTIAAAKGLQSRRRSRKKAT